MPATVEGDPEDDDDALVGENPASECSHASQGTSARASPKTPRGRVSSSTLGWRRCPPPGRLRRSGARVPSRVDGVIPSSPPDVSARPSGDRRRDRRGGVRGVDGAACGGRERRRRPGRRPRGVPGGARVPAAGRAPRRARPGVRAHCIREHGAGGRRGARRPPARAHARDLLDGGRKRRVACPHAAHGHARRGDADRPRDRERVSGGPLSASRDPLRRARLGRGVAGRRSHAAAPGAHGRAGGARPPRRARRRARAPAGGRRGAHPHRPRPARLGRPRDQRDPRPRRPRAAANRQRPRGRARGLRDHRRGRARDRRRDRPDGSSPA